MKGIGRMETTKNTTLSNAQTDLTDILYEKNNGIAKITINRPDVYNAFRAQNDSRT